MPTAGQTTVWLADLDAADAGQDATDLLSDDERARAGRFVFDLHRRRFIVCRAWLRVRLAERLGVAPRDLQFHYGPMGKPALAGAGTLRFNVSHSDRHALLAIADGIELGIDIERVRPVTDMDALAERVFSEAERAALGRVPPERRVEAFFDGWTRKEAYIKARGEGIARLRAIEVALTPGEPPRLIRVDEQPEEPQRWVLEALSPVPGFAAALCMERPARPL
jgi:4'-phosphopantetheinyl transferase